MIYNIQNLLSFKPQIYFDNIISVPKTATCFDLKLTTIIEEDNVLIHFFQNIVVSLRMTYNRSKHVAVLDPWTMLCKYGCVSPYIILYIVSSVALSTFLYSGWRKIHLMLRKTAQRCVK
jgi:hypothetical protein